MLIWQWAYRTYPQSSMAKAASEMVAAMVSFLRRTTSCYR